MDGEREKALDFKLIVLHDRINDIAAQEARTALVRGLAATEALHEEKMRLIARTEKILTELMSGKR